MKSLLGKQKYAHNNSPRKTKNIYIILLSEPRLLSSLFAFILPSVATFVLYRPKNGSIHVSKFVSFSRIFSLNERPVSSPP